MPTKFKADEIADKLAKKEYKRLMKDGKFLNLLYGALTATECKRISAEFSKQAQAKLMGNDEAEPRPVKKRGEPAKKTVPGGSRSGASFVRDALRDDNSSADISQPTTNTAPGAEETESVVKQEEGSDVNSAGCQDMGNGQVQDFVPDQGTKTQSPNDEEANNQGDEERHLAPDMGIKSQAPEVADSDNQGDGDQDLTPDNGIKSGLDNDGNSMGQHDEEDDDAEEAVTDVESVSEVEVTSADAFNGRNPYGLTVENVAATHPDLNVQDHNLRTATLFVQHCETEKLVKNMMALITLYEEAQASRPNEAKDGETQDQAIVYGIKNAEFKSELARIEGLYYHSRLATRTNEIRNKFHQESPGANKRRRGQGVTTDVYDRYILAESVDQREFNKIQQDPKRLKAKRKAWGQRCAVGHKLNRCIEKFGFGFILLTPAKFTTSFVRDISQDTIALILFGLENAPWSNAFKRLCGIASEKFQELIQDGEQPHKVLHAASKELCLAVKRKEIEEPHLLTQALEQVIHTFPARGCIAVGEPAVQIDKVDVMSLGVNQEVNDQVIKAMLSIRLQQLHKNIGVCYIDPQSVNEKFDATSDFNLDEKDQVKIILIPYHHTQPNQWSLVCVYVKDRLIVHYDSFPAGRKARSEQVNSTVVEILKKIYGKVKKGENRWKCQSGTCADQEGFDCGVHVIVNALHIICNHDTQYLPQSMNGLAKRLEIAQELVFEAFEAHDRWKGNWRRNDDDGELVV